MLDRLPKDIIIKLIHYVEAEYKKKYFKTKTLFEMVYHVYDDSLEFYICCHDECSEFCFTYSINEWRPNLFLRVVTSQNVRIDKLLLDENEDSCPLEKKDFYSSCGFLCASDYRWSCNKHWKDYVIEKDQMFTCPPERLKCEKVTYSDNIYLILNQYPDGKINLNKLSKDVLLKAICEGENDWQRKYVGMKKLFDSLNKLGGSQLKHYKCVYKSCNEQCFVFDKEEGELSIVTSHHSRDSTQVTYSIRHWNGESFDSRRVNFFDRYGVLCEACPKWSCANHWRQNVDINNARDHLNCNACDN